MDKKPKNSLFLFTFWWLFFAIATLALAIYIIPLDLWLGVFLIIAAGIFLAIFIIFIRIV